MKDHSRATMLTPLFARLITLASLAIVAGQPAHAQVYTVLHKFHGTDGSNPEAAPAIDTAGNLYGTTMGGGDLTCDLPFGCGVIYKLAPAGHLTVLHVFAGESLAFAPEDGSLPMGGLIADPEGNMYGTSYSGGDGCRPSGCGTVFKLNGQDKVVLLHNFAGGPNDGSAPVAGLLRDSAGNLYGSTGSGGVQNVFGSAFMLTTDGAETMLHLFTSAPDGSFPQSALTSDPAGNLYGTTAAGGSLNNNCMGVGCGTVYELTPGSSGWTETVIYSFLGGTDGLAPRGNLLQDSAGNFYGVTGGGGNTNCGSFGCGTVFELSPGSGGWTESILYRFTGASDGANPAGGLVQDSVGNLYGISTSSGDPTCGCGTVFKLSSSGVLTTLHTFTGPDGARPSGLFLSKADVLYGAAAAGGDTTCNSPNGCGVIFKITQ